jgi:hypothetical protein
VLAAEYQEKTRMRIIRGSVGVVAMWSSTLNSLIFAAFEPMTIMIILMIWYHWHCCFGMMWYHPRLYEGMMWYPLGL